MPQRTENGSPNHDNFNKTQSVALILNKAIDLASCKGMISTSIAVIHPSGSFFLEYQGLPNTLKLAHADGLAKAPPRLIIARCAFAIAANRLISGF